MYVPISISIKADREPVFGERCAVTATAKADVDLPDVTVEISVPRGGRIIGNPTKTVSQIKKDEPVQFRAQVFFTSPGILSVEASARSVVSSKLVWSSADHILFDIGAQKSEIVRSTANIYPAPQASGKIDAVRLRRLTAEEAKIPAITQSEI